MPYTYEEAYFGIPAPGDGQTGLALDEQQKAALIGRLFQRVSDAVGEGVIEGGVGSIVGGDLQISAVTAALIRDEIGAVPVQADLTTLPASSFATGDSYVHLQLTSIAREDGSCGYYISASATPASDALAICMVTKAGGVITAVDNTVKAVPAVAGRIPWEVLKRNYDDVTTLLEFLTEELGARYMDGTAPDDVDTRLTAVETGGVGVGGATVYWGDLQRTASLATTIAQYVTSVIADHLANYSHGGGDGGGEISVVEPWDMDAANRHLALMLDVLMDNPMAAFNQVDCMVVVVDEEGNGVWGQGELGGPDWVDHVNSTWP